MRQETLTVVARVVDVPALRRGLSLIREDMVGGSGARAFQPRAFEGEALGVHFARLVLVPASQDGAFSDWLAFESNFDTTEADAESARRQHLALLAQHAKESLGLAFAHCEGFPRSGTAAEFADYLEKRLVAATASYQGHVERDLQRIRLEQHLREVILTFFESAESAPKAELFKRVRDHVRFRARVDPRLAGFNVDAEPPPAPDPDRRSERLAHRVEPWVQNIAPALPILNPARLWDIYTWQRSDVEYDYQASQEAWTDEHRRRFVEVSDSEDHGVQNAITHVVPLREGQYRLAILKAAHAYIDRMAKEYFDDIGQLGGIPSIHFAKWLLVDDEKRLLFFSNYDSSWESYLGDFVDQAAIGLNLAWSCCDSYPRTRFLAWGGADDEERFKAWGRAYQEPTQVFYSAYPELSIAAINNNSAIRYGLQARPSAAEIGAWFRRLT
ncbi:MAG TPA: hypothetical protein VFQ35_17555 [Polyangiaceae bacterium]|nr:hypothetical protein [Polyangiaceae bacterium]